jgi:tetratricopeptide (TPR) repeat protein
MADPAAESPEEAYLKRERTESLLRLIDELPPDWRDPFILRVFHEMSYLEIAERFNLTEGAGRKRIQEARQRLEERFRECLEEHGEKIAGDLVGSLAAEINGEFLSQEMQRRVERILSATLEEIRYQVQETRVVHIPLPSGAVLTYNLALDFKPARRSSRIETLRQYIRKHPGGWKQRLELANLLYANGQWEEAIQEYRQVLEKQPQSLDVWLRLGEMLREMERSQEALAVYEEALQKARSPGTQHHLQGVMALCHRDYDTAIRELKRAVELEPQKVLHQHTLARTLLQAHHYPEALQVYDAILEKDPDDIVALTNSHDALFPTGRFTEVKERLERVVELDPNFVLVQPGGNPSRV